MLVLSTIDRCVAGVVRAGSVLALPLSLLLFLQWPLRDVVQAYSREANDLAQILFALYVAIAVTAATREDVHIAVDALARAYPPRVRSAIRRIGALVFVIPWSIFVLHAAWPDIAQSTRLRESFPETFNPGYFVLKIALGLLALLVLVQALLGLVRPARDS
jgi:TRAP-type mannitol/chloroaromatic compound transport system permease small subunit